jgi:hypothetical protein
MQLLHDTPTPSSLLHSTSLARHRFCVSCELLIQFARLLHCSFVQQSGLLTQVLLLNLVLLSLLLLLLLLLWLLLCLPFGVKVHENLLNLMLMVCCLLSRCEPAARV